MNIKGLVVFDAESSDQIVCSLICNHIISGCWFVGVIVDACVLVTKPSPFRSHGPDISPSLRDDHRLQRLDVLGVNVQVSHNDLWPFGLLPELPFGYLVEFISNGCLMLALPPS